MAPIQNDSEMISGMIKVKLETCLLISENMQHHGRFNNRTAEKNSDILKILGNNYLYYLLAAVKYLKWN